MNARTSAIWLLSALAAACGAQPAAEQGSRPAVADPNAASANAASQRGDDGTSARPTRMLRLTLRLDAGRLEVVSAVEAKNTVNRRDPHRASRAFFRAVAKDGTVLEERGFRLEEELRSEGVGPDGGLEGTRVPSERPVFSIAVPLHDDLKTIEIYRSDRPGDRRGAKLLGEVSP